MSEFIPGICWQTFNCKDIRQTSVLVNSKFKMLRIFIDMANLWYAEPTQEYINSFMNTVDGLSRWTYENKPGLFQSNSIVRDSFDFCLKNGWLPIVCMGYREEQPHNWLGRNPSEDKWNWLGKFSKAFAQYLENMGFKRADVEIWNEPTKCLGWDIYSKIAYIMGKNWKSVNPNYKLHIFADDSFRTGYLRDLFNNVDLIRITDYIPIHVGVGTEQKEWDDNQIKIVKQIISKYPHLKLAVTEMSPNGKWGHMEQLIDYGVSMYGLFWAIRKQEVGTAFVIDDIWHIKPDGSVICSSNEKRDFLTNFNSKYYKPYTIIPVEEDMEFFKNKTELKLGSKGMDVKFIQKVCNKEQCSNVPITLVIDGRWGVLTDNAVRDLNTFYGFAVNPRIIDKKRFNFYIDKHPNILDQVQVSYYMGER
jgi:hypothetical protein